MFTLSLAAVPILDIFLGRKNAANQMIDIAASEFKEMGHCAMPILKVIGDADVYCVNESGDIVRWSHEEDIFEPFKGTFFDLLSYELRESEERRVKKFQNA
ncbi:hypothetical protein KW507_07820 [Vibrio fluvialis]|nr:hypothetical protein [Vibrio fluvialis]